MAVVQKERDHYCSVLKTCEENLKKVFSAGEQIQVLPPFREIPAMSNKTTMHYNFDMAQQVYT